MSTDKQRPFEACHPTWLLVLEVASAALAVAMYNAGKWQVEWVSCKHNRESWREIIPVGDHCSRSGVWPGRLGASTS